MKRFDVLALMFVFTGIALLGFGCAPMAGTSKLVYQSTPQKPHWMQVIPQSRTYEYFLGVSDNRTSLDEAKKAAILDAFNDAVSKKGIEVSVNYQGLTTEDRSSIKDRIDVSGAMKLGLEQVSWYYEEWEQYYRNRAQKAYRVFVLMRSRKIHPSNFLMGIAINIGNRLDAFWHSMLIPGWGQYRYGKKGKGNYFLFLTAFSGTGWATSNVLYEKIRDDQYGIQEDLKNAVGIKALDLQKKYAMNEKHLKDLKGYKRGFMYATLGVYGLNLLDAVLFGPPSTDKFSSVSISKHLCLTLNQNGYFSGIRLIYEFSGK